MVDVGCANQGVDPSFTLVPPVKERGKKKKKPAKKEKAGADRPNHPSNPKKDRPYFVK